MSTKWKKCKKPYRAELIHNIDLETDGSVIASASKKNPIPGTVTDYAYKKIGNNNVEVCYFRPDIRPECGWEISRKWLRMIKDKNGINAD